MIPQIYSFVKDDKGIFRPWVPVRIINPLISPAQSITTHALLDTGADECVFPQFTSEQTGHNLKAEGIRTKEMQGVSQEKINVWFHTFKIELLTPDLKNVFWSSKNCEVACVDHDNILPILGFSNFMCNFKITFNHTTKKIIVDTRTTI